MGRASLKLMDLTSAIYLGVFYSISSRALEAVWFLIWLLIPRVYKYSVSEYSPIFESLDKKLKGLHTNKKADGTPTGLIIGRWYIAYRSTAGDERDKVDIICMSSFIDSCERKDVNLARINYRINGTSWTVNKISRAPTKEQARVMDEITAHAGKFVNGVYIIWGPSGTGKSSIVDMLAVEFKLSVMLGFDMTKSEYFSTCGRITVINECDDVLDEVIGVNKSGKKEELVPKAKWNNLLDFVNSAHSTILILTTNVNPAKYDAVDPSLLRRARIRARFHMKKVIA